MKCQTAEIWIPELPTTACVSIQHVSVIGISFRKVEPFQQAHIGLSEATSRKKYYVRAQANLIRSNMREKSKKRHLVVFWTYFRYSDLQRKVEPFEWLKQHTRENLVNRWCSPNIIAILENRNMMLDGSQEGLQPISKIIIFDWKVEPTV